MPNVLASSGTIGTILSPTSLSFKRPVITLTAAIVVEIFLSPEPSSNLANIFASGLGKVLETALLFGIDPPRASLVFLRY